MSSPAPQLAGLEKAQLRLLVTAEQLWAECVISREKSGRWVRFDLFRGMQVASQNPKFRIN